MQAERVVLTFEYAIGEVVFIRCSRHCLGVRPKPFIITERFAQQCHGGTQLLYKLLGAEDLIPEIALTRERSLLSAIF